jgi:phosphomannomutase
MRAETSALPRFNKPRAARQRNLSETKTPITKGNPINSNRFIALMAAIVLRDKPGSTVVTDSVTSNGLTDFIASLGGVHCR